MHNIDLSQIRLLATNLETLLEDEYEALKTQSIDTFETLQPEKLNIFEKLAGSGVFAEQVDEDDAEKKRLTELLESPVWSDITSILERCKLAHQRNEHLISKQLDAIKGALAALQIGPDKDTVEIYTKMGKMAQLKRSMLSGDA